MSQLSSPTGKTRPATCGASRACWISADSLVFVDDNPAERDIVRRELPEVAVPELPDDADYPARIAAAGYFEAVSFTSDDAERGRSYALNAERKSAQSQATDMDGYLRGLQMVLRVSRIGSAELARATQLINKTNQFNLTTRRYTEAEVERMASDRQAIALALRLEDKFGDSGLISVVLARPDAAIEADELLIDSWLMSCRAGPPSRVGAAARGCRCRGCPPLANTAPPNATAWSPSTIRDWASSSAQPPITQPPMPVSGAASWRHAYP